LLKKDVSTRKPIFLEWKLRKGQVLTLDLLQENPVVAINNPLNLGVAGVGLHSHQLLGKLLVEVDLAGFDDAAVVDCAVLGDGPVGVDLDVDVQGSADLKRGCVVSGWGGEEVMR
jgi:hypothetical protein